MGHQRKFNRNHRRSQARLERKSQRRWPPSAEPPFDPDSCIESTDGGFMIGASLDKLDPAGFVGFVSSTIAVIEDRDAGAPADAMQQVIETSSRDRTPMSHALLIGLAAMAPRADDRIHAKRLVAERSEADRDRLPSWIAGFEQAVAVKAFAHRELWWGRSFLGIELRLGDQSLCVIADIGHVERYVVTKGHLYPGTIDGFLEQFPEIMMTPGTWTDYVDLGRAGAQLTEAIRRSDDTDMYEAFLEDEWQPMRAELLWAARLAGAAGSFEAPEPTECGIDPLFDPESVALSPTEIAAVVDDFRNSPHGRRAHAEGVDQGIDLIVGYATTVGHGRLECWGPRRAAMFLHSYVLAEVWDGDIDLSTVPRLLEHWIHFTNERAEMPASMAEETIDRIHDVTPIFDAMLRAREQSVRDAAADLVAARFRD